jgi:hypothetical protein
MMHDDHASTGTSESSLFVASFFKSRRGGLYILLSTYLSEKDWARWEEGVDASMQNTTADIDLSWGEERRSLASAAFYLLPPMFPAVSHSWWENGFGR